MSFLKEKGSWNSLVLQYLYTTSSTSSLTCLHAFVQCFHRHPTLTCIMLHWTLSRIRLLMAWTALRSTSKLISVMETNAPDLTNVAQEKYLKSWRGRELRELADTSPASYPRRILNVLILHSFDQARLIRQNRILAENGIHPSGI